MSRNDFRFDSKLLWLSLVQDFRSLDHLNKKIIEENQITVYSWLYPHQSATTESEETVFPTIQSDKDHIKCLELIIDRIYSVLNVFVELFENMPRNRAKIQRNIAKPKKLTLGLTATALHEKIQQLSAIMRDDRLYTVENPPKDEPETRPEKPNPNSDKETQVNIEITNCKSCAIAQKCIKAIAGEFCCIDKDTNVSRAKGELKNSLFSSTQEQSLDILTKAINADVKELFDHSWGLEVKLEDLKKELNEVDCNHQDSLRKIGELEGSVLELEQCKDKEIRKQGSLHNIINKLYKEKKQFETDIKEKNDRITPLQSLVDTQTATINNLQQRIDELEKNTKSLLSQQELLDSEKELWKIRFNNTHEENKKLKNVNEELAGKLEELRKGIFAVETSLQDLDKSILDSNTVIDQNFSAYEDLLKKTQDVVSANALLEQKLKENQEKNSNIGNSAVAVVTSDIEVRGDPMLDMLKQIECNKANIRKMEQQNETLMKTVKRFQNLNIPNKNQ